ncbi:FG-GAP repeat domain-containing protein, partial [Winogradskyella sp.]|uniref:FG-GAP repeat domain-containing protein n=1 Tax=Winogradskyella sp. TaxID=1883156 RepID=UPI003F6A3D34
MRRKLPLELSFLVLIIACFFTQFGSSQNFERVENTVGLSVLQNNNGVAVADYDGDNDLDIFVVANAVENSEDPSSFSRLFRNNN